MEKFTVGNEYLDRKGRVYTFERKSSGEVLVFKSEDGISTCRHISGNFRWDGLQTEEDIIIPKELDSKRMVAKLKATL